MSTRRPPVPAVARATKILETLAESSKGLTLTELSLAAGAPKSSVLAICSTLVDAGFVVRNVHGAYELGIRVIQLGRDYLARSDIVAEFWRTNEDLPLLTEDTLVLSVLDGTSVVYVACRKGARPVAVSYEIGLRLPAHCTASGKSLLASLPRSQVDSLYGQTELEHLTDRSIRTLPRLRIELDKIRKRGYAIDDEETAYGMRCLGTVVVDGTGSAPCAVSISMVKAARTCDETSTAQDLLAFTARLSERLGGPRDGSAAAIR